MAKRGRPQALPGLEDRAITELQEAGLRYAEIRDERIRLNREEATLKQEIRTLMHKHRKKKYEDVNVTIDLEPPDGEEQVKVKVKKPRSLDADTDTDDGDSEDGDETRDE